MNHMGYRSRSDKSAIKSGNDSTSIFNSLLHILWLKEIE